MTTLPNWSNPALYKTRLCDHFRTKGDCKFGVKCWFAHGRDELRSVPRLDRHPEAALNAVAQVIESLPPSRSREVAVNKGQQLFNELKQRKTIESDDLPDLLRDLMIPPPPAYPQKPARRQQHCPSNFIYYPMPVAYFAPEMFGYTVISPTMHK